MRISSKRFVQQQKFCATKQCPSQGASFCCPRPRHTHAPADRPRLLWYRYQCRHVLTHIVDAARRGPEITRHQIDKSSFSGPVCTDNTDHFTGVNTDGNLLGTHNATDSGDSRCDHINFVNHIANGSAQVFDTNFILPDDVTHVSVSEAEVAMQHHCHQKDNQASQDKY